MPRFAISLLLFIFVTAIFPVSYFSVHGWDCEARVDTLWGYFGVGKYSTSQRLTFEYPNPASPSCYIAFKFDGSAVYTWPGTAPPFFNLNASKMPGYPRRIAGNTIQNRWNIVLAGGEQINISLYITPRWTLLMGDTLGIIQFRYIIQNNGLYSHTVQVEHRYDINIAGRDNAPVSIPGSFADTNCVYLTGGIPGRFHAAQFTISDTITQLVAMGIVNSDDAALTPPVFFAYGNEIPILTQNFTLGPSFAGGTYYNSGAMVRWGPPYNLFPGSTIELKTYYGLGKILIDYGQLVLAVSGSNWTAANCELAGNPREFQAMLRNNSSGLVYFDSTWVCIRYDSALAELVINPADIYHDSLCVSFLNMATGASRLAPWLFRAFPDTFGNFCITFRCSTNYVPPVRGIDTTFCFNIPYIDGTPPIVNFIQPIDSFTACTTGRGLSAWIAFRDSMGIHENETRVSVRVRGTSTIVDRTTPNAFFWRLPSTYGDKRDTLVIPLDSLRTISYGTGDTIRICVLHAEDERGCSLDVPICRNIIVDRSKPVIFSIDPPPRSVVRDRTPTIRVGIIDSISGVDSMKIFYRVNGVPFAVHTSPSSYNPITKIMTHDITTLLPNESWVRVCIDSVADRTGLPCGPNWFRDSCWTFFVDSLGPRLSLVRPAVATVVSCDTFQIIISASDSLCLDSLAGGTVAFTPSGPVIDLLSPSVDWTCNRIYLNNVSIPEGNVTMTVTGVGDLAGNVCDVTVFSFRVDTTGPAVVPGSIQPPSGSSVSPTFSCSLIVREESGLSYATDSPQMRFRVTSSGTHFRGWPHPSLSVASAGSFNTYLKYRNSISGFSLVEGDTVRCCLIAFNDIATLCPPNRLQGDSTCWFYIIDGTGPAVSLLWPAQGSISACDPLNEIVFRIADPSGVNPASVRFTVAGYPSYSVINTSADTFKIIIPPVGFIPKCPDTVKIRLDNAADFLGNSTSGLQWWFIIDTLAPNSPRPTWRPLAGGAVSPADTIRFFVEPGCIGWFNHCSTTVRLMISPSPGLDIIKGCEPGVIWVRDTFKIALSDIPGIDDRDTVCVQIARLLDSLQYMSILGCEPSSRNDLAPIDEWCFRISAGGPMITRIQPRRRFVSCGNFNWVYRVRDDDGLNVNTMRFIIEPGGASPITVSWPSPLIDTSWVTPTSELICSLSLNLATYGITHGESLCVTFDRIDDMLGIRNESSNRYCVVVDTTDPCPVWFEPNGIEISTRTPLIRARIPADLAPLVADSLAFSLDGSLTWIWHGDPSGAVYWGTGDTAIFDVSRLPSAMWPDGGDTVRICVRNTDQTDTLIGCANNTCSRCWRFWIASAGPVPLAISPGRNWIWECPRVDSLIISLTDPDGIDSLSIRVSCSLRVAGTGFTLAEPTTNLRHPPQKLIVIPPIALSSEDTVDVWVSGADNLGNALAGGTYRYYFIIDHSAPVNIHTTPVCIGDSVSDPSPIIWLNAQDIWGRVDSLSWCVRFLDPIIPAIWDTVCYSTAPTAWIFTGSRDSVGLNTELAPVGPWTGGDTIVFQILRVCDVSDTCGPNCAPRGSICSLAIASRGPDVTNIWPAGNGIIGCVQPDTFIFAIEDADGIDTSAVMVFYRTCTYPLDTFTLSDVARIVRYRRGTNIDTLYFVPPGTIPQACSIWISIFTKDAIGNNVVPNEFRFIYDYTPPSFEIVYPIDSAFSFTPTCTLVFADNVAGVDTMSVTVSIVSWCSTPLSISSPAPDTLIWLPGRLGLPETLIVDFDHLTHCLSTRDTVCMNVFMACDNSVQCPACSTYDTTWCFIIAQGGPEAHILNADTICPEDPIIISIIDPDGINIIPVQFTVNSILMPYPSPFFDWDSSAGLLTFNPSPDFDRSYLRICISGVRDGLDNRMVATCWNLRVDVDPPIPFYVSPTGIIDDHQPDIVIAVHDSMNVIRESCFILSINGTEYSVDGTILTWTPFADSLVSPMVSDSGLLVWSAFAAGETLLSGSTVEVCLIDACDSTGCLNDNHIAPDTICWTFMISYGSGPGITLVSPTECGLSISCTTGAQFVWSISDTDGVNPASIIIQYFDGVSVDSFTVGSPEVSFADDTLRFTPPPFPSAGIISVSIVSVTDMLGNPGYPLGSVCNFIIDWSAPYVIGFRPADSSEIGSPYPLIWFAVRDSLSTIDHATGRIWVNGVPYDTTDTEVWWSRDTIFFYPSVGFAGGETIIVCLDSVADSTILCPANVIAETCFVFYINADGPIVSLIFPDTLLSPMTTFCDSGAFWVLTVDPERLDSISVEVEWNGIPVRWEDRPDLFDFRPGDSYVDTVLVWPPMSYNDGDLVCLRLVSWPDSISNPYFGDINWCAVVDNSAPETVSVSPINNEITNTWTPRIIAVFRDRYSWVDHSSVSMTITRDGLPWGTGIFTLSSPELNWSAVGDTLIFHSDSAFNEFSQICVSVMVRDSSTIAMPMNCMPNQTSYTWCFTIGDDDTIGPMIVVAESCMVRAGDNNFSIIVGLADNDRVFDDYSTDTTGQGLIAHFILNDGTPRDFWVPMQIIAVTESIGVPGDSIYWAESAPGAIPGNQIVIGTTLCYEIFMHDDDFDFDNPIDRQLAVSEMHCCFIFNNVPPSIVITSPLPGSFVSCRCADQAIRLELQDVDQIVADSLLLFVEGIPYTVHSPQITWDPGYIGHHNGRHLLTFIPDQANCWTNGQIVDVCLRGIYDSYLNRTQDSCWSFTVDFEPPTAWCITAVDTNVEITELDSIVFVLRDNISGVNPYNISLLIELVHLGSSSFRTVNIATDPALVYDPVTGSLRLYLRYLSGLNLSREDSLFFYILHAQDLTTLCPPNSIDSLFLCVRYIKPITKCYAGPQPFTPPPPADGINDEVIFDFPNRIDVDAVVKIYDMRGNLMKEIKPAGAHRYAWTGYDINDVPARPGVYLYVIEQGGEVICSGTVVLAR